MSRSERERMESRSDQELVRLLARGDHAAFEAIYERCRRPVFRFAMHMSGSHEIADEVTQDTFLFLLREPNAFRESKGTLQSFLMGVARNLVRRSRREATEDRSLEEEGIEEMIRMPETRETPLEVAIRRQSAEVVQAALLQIPASYREIVVLCDLQEMSYAEAAALVGVPIGTVRSRLHRGHLALLDQLSRSPAAVNSGVKP